MGCGSCGHKYPRPAVRRPPAVGTPAVPSGGWSRVRQAPLPVPVVPRTPRVTNVPIAIPHPPKEA